METLIIKNLSKIYKNRYIVKSISLYLAAGEIIGLLGPNGSGKTTIFYMILGIIQQSSGSILLNNKNIQHIPIYSRARLGIGYLPQDSSIFRQLTVFDNLMSIAQIQRNISKKERYEYIIQLMHSFHIHHLKDNLGKTLSGGERKRVEIARSLISKPKFMLLDEPFSGVDPISIRDIQKIIMQLINYKLGILITDHNVKATLNICQRIYVINQGILIAHGSPKKILSNKYVREVYLGDPFL